MKFKIQKIQKVQISLIAGSIIAGIASLGFYIPFASASSIESPAVSQVSGASAAVQSFPAQKFAGAKNIFVESTEVKVSKDVHWKSTESLNTKDVSVASKPAPVQQPSVSGIPSIPATPVEYNGPASQTGAALVAFASQFAGKVPYVWGGVNPSTGWDCSGFTSWVYAHFGVRLPHSSYAQGNYGKEVPASDAQPGDLMVQEGGAHVGIYMGNGLMVHASDSRKNTVITPTDWAKFKYYNMF